MPIATTAAILGAAAIGAAGSALSSKSNSKAINNATAAQQTATNAQIAAQQQARAENSAALAPYMARGNAAGETINAALGLGGTVAPAQPAALTYDGGFMPPYALNPGGYGYQGEPVNGANGAYVQQTGPAQAPQGGQTPAQAAANAYELFKQSTGYQTRFSEGNRSLAANYFGGGVGQSGAAIKAALKYGQNFASNEFGNWLGALGNQQGVGFSAASANAGVSQGFADRLSEISQNNANATASAAALKANNNNAFFGSLAGIAGQTAGALSSYRPPYNYAALAPDVNRTISANPGLF
jgi:hypothetical protein